MDQYVGLDVSQDETHVCVVDRDGNKLWEGSCPSTPEGIGETVKKHAPEAVIFQHGTGTALTTWGFQPFVLMRTMRTAFYAYK